MRATTFIAKGLSVVAAWPLLAASASAQSAPAPAAAPTAAPVAAAPAQAATPPAADTAATAPDAFSLSEALSGGVAMSASEVAKRAVASSPSVSRAEKAVARSRAAAEQARLGVYPRLDLEARYTRLSDTSTGAFTTNIETTINTPTGPMTTTSTNRIRFPVPRLDQLMLQASLMYPVSSLFFSVLPRHRAGMLAADAEALQKKVQEQQISVMAKEAYYNYARARAALMVARAALSQAEAHRRDVDALVTSGTVARVELMRADAQVSASRVAVSRVEGQVAVARVALASLMHTQATDVAVTENLEEVLPPLTQDGEGYLQTARKRRSEIAALRTLLDMHEHFVDAQDGDALPKLNVGASAEFSNPNQRYSSFLDKWYGSWAAFASVTWSPNDMAFADKGKEQSRADMALVREDLANIDDALRTEVVQAVEDYNAARASMEAALSGIAAAEESYRVRREQFRAGAATATDVIDSENDLRGARLDLVNASIDGRIAKARLDRAIEAE